MSAQRSFIAVYGLAHFGKSLFWYASEILFAYFLTEACGLEPRLMALVLSGSLLLSAVADFIVGRTLTSRIRDSRSAGRAQAGGAVLSAIAFAAFGLAGLCPPDIRLAYAGTAIVVFRLCYSFFDVPQNAILALSTETDPARARLSAYRYMFGGFASLAISILFVPLLRGRQISVQALNFAALSIALSVVVLATSTALFLLLLQNPGRLEVAAPHMRLVRPQRLSPDWRLGLIFVMLASVAAESSAFGKLEPYLAAYGLTSAANAAAVLTSIALGNLISQPLWALIGERYSLMTSLRASALLLAIAAVLFSLVVRLDIAASGLAGALYGCSIGGLSMTLWAFAAGAAGKTRWLNGAASTFGLVTALSKIGSAGGVLAVGEILAATAYRDRSTWAHQLLLVMTLIPMATAVICAVASIQITRR